MMNQYPDTSVSIQEHVGDSYAFNFTSERYSSYGGGGTPLTWFDGVIGCLGAITNDNDMYAWYQDQYLTRIAAPTDLDLTIAAAETSTNTYTVDITVTMDADGTSKDLICHLFQVLDNYPASSDHRYRNCARKHRQELMTLNPGGSYSFSKSIGLDTVDAANIEEVKFIAFIQIQGDTGAREIYNTSVLAYPFTQPVIVGDVDGDGDVDLSDLAALLSVYGTCSGDPGYNDAADFEDNDCIDIADLAALLSNYGYGG